VVVGLSTLKFSHGATSFYDKQLGYLWAGMLACLVFWRVPYFVWTNRVVVPILWGINMGLLLAVMLKGHSALGAQRWLAIGPITLQPSELAKLVVIFTLAAWFRSRPIKSFFDTFKAAAIIIPPAILVFKQPDLGTSLTFGAVFLGMCFWARATL
jgi:rod shape determining protein RodA